MDPHDDVKAPPVSPEDKKGPEEYIRTLAGDIDIVQRGGTPGLAPLKPSAPEPAERLIESSPIIPEVAAPQPKVETPAPAPEPPKPAAPAGPVPLETYAGDFQEHVGETHASAFSMLAAQQDAGPVVSIPEESTQPDTRSRWYIAGGVLFVILGVAGGSVVVSNYLANNAPAQIVTLTTNAPIFVDSTTNVSGTGNALMNSIVQALATPIPIGTVRQLVWDNATSTTPIFLNLGVPVPGILVRNISSDGSFAGIAHASSGQSVFFILPVDFYSATFSGMLSWESTMQRDLHALYPLPAAPTTASSTASSTPAATTTVAVTPQAGFKDAVVSNHDVRLYQDSFGRAVLVYGYWNQNTLVIARDPAAFTEALNRLATSHTK